MEHFSLRSTRWASKAGGRFPRRILGKAIRAIVSVEAAHEFLPQSLAFVRSFCGIHFLQDQSQSPPGQTPARSRPARRAVSRKDPPSIKVKYAGATE
jgi:hypothetical protein